MAHLRRLVAALAASFFVILSTAFGAVATPAPPARGDAPATTAGQLSPSYTYWGYYAWDDAKSAWVLSPVGANDTASAPEDGDVIGFRWALSVKEDRPPRADGDFDAICGSEPAADGEKRVAFVIDYGTQADAGGDAQPPAARGVCATVNEEFTSQQALQTVADVRIGSSGFICGIDNYPSSGCGQTFDDATEPPPDGQVTLQIAQAQEGDSSTAAGGSTPTPEPHEVKDRETSAGEGVALTVVLAGGFVVILAGAGLWLRKHI